MPAHTDAPVRHDWTLDEVAALFELPFADLLYSAQSVHRAHFDPNALQMSTLLSIKTGGCPEDCAYCPQSVHFDTGVGIEQLLDPDVVRERAQAARAGGATRFCMGAAWRRPTDRQIEQVIQLVDVVHQEHMESCITLGMLSERQAARLGEAGLAYYNHNLDTSPEYYGEIISTRTYQDRLETLDHVREAGIKVCCGGIIGMGEARRDRAELLRQLANQPEHPESVPINLLVQVAGTPLYGAPEVDELEFVRSVAVARILMPGSVVRLAAGREQMNPSMQALCFLAGANSVFGGEQLLTTPNPERDTDAALFDQLGVRTHDVRPLETR